MLYLPPLGYEEFEGHVGRNKPNCTFLQSLWAAVTNSRTRFGNVSYMPNNVIYV